MARKVRDSAAGAAFLSLGPGIEARARYLESGMPGIGSATREAWQAGTPFTMLAVDVWSALRAADHREADRFAAWLGIGFRHDGTELGTGYRRDDLRVIVDPRSSSVAPNQESDASTIKRQGRIS